MPYTSDIPDGTRVTLTGTVYDLSFTKTGGHLLINLSGTTVFVPNGGTTLTLLDNDNITVVGTVSTYAGKKEIIVETLSDIRQH